MLLCAAGKRRQRYYNKRREGLFWHADILCCFYRLSRRLDTWAGRRRQATDAGCERRYRLSSRAVMAM
jgi:hypothetical protein